jgi:hypothetical protein
VDIVAETPVAEKGGVTDVSATVTKEPEAKAPESTPEAKS